MAESPDIKLNQNDDDDAYDDPDTALAFADVGSAAFAKAKRSSILRKNIENNIARVDNADDGYFSLGVVGPRTIGTVSDRSDDSSSDDEGSFSDDSSQENADDESKDPLFQKFERSWRGVRKNMPPPAPGIVFVHGQDATKNSANSNAGSKDGEQSLAKRGQSKDAGNIKHSRIVDVEYLPKFLQKTPLFRRAMSGGNTTEKGDGLAPGVNDNKRKYSEECLLWKMSKKSKSRSVKKSDS